MINPNATNRPIIEQTITIGIPEVSRKEASIIGELIRKRGFWGLRGFRGVNFLQKNAEAHSA
jgi:hypothetical protein